MRRIPRTKLETTYRRRLSPNQYALMRGVATGRLKRDVTMEMLNGTALTSLVRRGYLTVDSHAKLTFTDMGHCAYATYQELDVPMRRTPDGGQAYPPVSKYIAMMFDIKRDRTRRGVA